jgi:hypothetical protein
MMRAVVTMGGQLQLGQEVVHEALAMVDPLLVVPAAPQDSSTSVSSSSAAERLAALVGAEAGPCQEQLLAGLLLQVRREASRVPGGGVAAVGRGPEHHRVPGTPLG